jgi:hypothetical protein
MNIRIFTLIPLFIAILFYAGESSVSASTGFIISGADAVEFVDTAPSPELGDLIKDVAYRFVVQAANELRYYDISPSPAELLGLIAQVKHRFVIQFANANQFYSFAFPVDMIGDIYPPVITNLAVTSTGSISWLTDEYAIGEVHYGNQSGNYTDYLSDGFYRLNHSFALSGLVEGQPYYLKVKAVDRSENIVWSSERSFTYQPLSSIYLPLLLHRSP